jgi:PAS domain S-box-containing protein
MNDPRVSRPAGLASSVERRVSRLLARIGLTAFQAATLALIVACGVGLSAVLQLHLKRLHARAIAAELAVAVQARTELLRSSWLRSLEALHATVDYLEVTPDPTREAFRQFALGPLERLPELQAVEWIPRVKRHERGRYEFSAVADGLIGYRFNELGPEGRLHVAGDRDEYFPVYYAEPPDRNLPALGLDLSAHPLRRSALDRAREHGRAAATAPVRLAQETRPGQLGLLVFAPVRQRGVVGDAGLRGFALVALRIADFAGPAFATLAREGLTVLIHDASHPELTLFASAANGGEATALAARLEQTSELDLAGRIWELEFATLPSFVSRHSSLEPVSYPLGALALTLLIAAYTARGMRRRRVIERRVDERTQALSHEIAVRRTAEVALRVAEAKYRTLFENALLGIFQSTPEGRYIDANPALANIYGYDSPDALMTTVRDIGQQLYVEPGERERFTAQLQEYGHVSDFVAEVRRKDGTTIWISETALAVCASNGEVLYYEGSVQDVSARVLAEEAQKRTFEWLEDRVRARTKELAETNLRLSDEVVIRKRAQEDAAQAREAQTQFLANLSHEIRTPLNAIIGYSQILQRYDIHAALHREALLAIVQGGHHLLSLVDEVIDLSKIESGHLQLHAADFDLGTLIAGLAYLFRDKCQRKGLGLRVEGLGGRPYWVRGDEGKLRQVLINLLGNALKFTERGELRLRVVPLGDDAFRFEVIDTGIGIAEGEQAHVFGEFYQAETSRSAEGAGLGLAISHRLVALMGGTLELRSTSGWGSNFYFRLGFEAPLAVVPSQANAQYPRIRLAAGTQCRVMVVDDLDQNRNVLCHMLTAIGCEVASASSGDDALGQLPDWEADLVFLDVLMPGKSGIETALELRRTAAGRVPKLVAFSASAFETQRTQYLESGFDAFMPKPFRIERINDCLAGLLGVTFAAEEPRALLDPALEPSSIELPADLVVQLRDAAESYQVTKLRQLFEQLERGGAAQAALAERLRASAARYDMSSLLEQLGQAAGDGGYAA